MLDLKNKVTGKNGFTGFLFQNNVIFIVGSAILITPLVLGFSAKYTAQAGNRLWAYLLIISFILFLVASFIGKDSLIGAIATGAALGVLFNAIISTSFGGKLVSRLNKTGSG